MHKDIWSPWQPAFFDLAFNELRGEPLLKTWDKIPNDTDILVTHGPPLGIGDRIRRDKRVGCAELLTTVMDRVKPKYHIFDIFTKIMECGTME